LERFIGILIEHLEGKWPLWLSPRQIMLVPVAKKFNIYAEEVQKQFVEAGFYADVDLSGKVALLFWFWFWFWFVDFFFTDFGEEDFGAFSVQLHFGGGRHRGTEQVSQCAKAQRRRRRTGWKRARNSSSFLYSGAV
jgi:hypothetical protein